MIDDALLEKLANYRPSEATITLLRATQIALIVGISGAGKNTIIQELLKTGKYHPVVSHTTRARRENHGVLEQADVVYHFIDVATAAKMIDDHAFVEVKVYSQNIYGTSAAEIQAARDEGKVALTDLEVKGVAEYAALTPTVRSIFVLPPSYEIWRQRLQARYGDDNNSAADDLRRRLQAAADELEQARAADYFSLVINEDLAQAVQEADRLARQPNYIPARSAEALQLIDDLLASVRDSLRQA